MKRFFILFPLLLTSILVACQSSNPQPVFTPSPEATLTPPPLPSATSSPLALTETATPPPMPVSYQTFSDMSAAQKAARFPLWLPGSVPDDLPLYKVWISDYADASENVRVLYSEPGAPLDANLKALDLQMTQTNQPVTLDSVMHQFRKVAWDVREVQVRGQPGFIYWTPGVAEGNSAHLDWREGTFNFSLSLFGNWPEPSESNPHGLDNLLLKIAGSLKVSP